MGTPLKRKHSVEISALGQFTDRYMGCGYNEDYTVKQLIERAKSVKKISGIERYFTDLETDIYTDEELEHLRQSAIPAINILMTRLNIDVRDL